MANENPTAIAVSNEHIRPLCRKLVDAKHLLDEVKAEFNSVGGIALFPNDAEPLADGAPGDGRAELANSDLRTIAGFINSILLEFDGAAYELVVKAQAIGQ